jgi:hypothetical protein
MIKEKEKILSIERSDLQQKALDAILQNYSLAEIREAFAVYTEKKQEWADAVGENLEVFPFSQDQVRTLTATKSISWQHPLTQISHALLTYFNVIDEPMMLHSEKAGASGDVIRSGCHCFYATVTFDNNGIAVFDNMGMGGMCPEEARFLRAYIPLPEWLAPHLQTLHAMAKEAMSRPAEEYVEPIMNYAWSSPKRFKALDLEQDIAP